MTRKLITAWIIRLEWIGDHAAVDDPIVDIVSGRMDEAYVRDYVQRLHDLLFLTFRERADIEREVQSASRPYATTVEHTKKGTIISVGHNPHILASKVNNLKIDFDSNSDKEIVAADGLEISRVMGFRDKISTVTGN